MTKKISLFGIISLLIIPWLVYSSPVNQKTAQSVALNFFKGLLKNPTQKENLVASLKYIRKEGDGTIDYYVFDISPIKGFVIITSDDNLRPVIAYSTTSNFDTTGERYGVADWMDEAANKIIQYKQAGIKGDLRMNSLWHSLISVKDTAFQNITQVGPLLQTTWNQNGNLTQPPYIYNTSCPFNSKDGEKCYTGCVATAMSQIMYYWKCPVIGIGSYSYNCINSVDHYDYGSQSATFSSQNFDWFSMPLFLNGGSSTAQVNDVATLMYDAGVSVAMNYGDYFEKGSGAWVLQEDAGNGNPCAQFSYANYFGYNGNKLQGVRARDYSSANWEALLENELNNGRVIQYAGWESDGGGHTWVCDGYETSPSTFFDMNWGWGGQNDGFYAIGSFNTSNGDFNVNDEALIGIVPQYIQIAIPPGKGATITCTSTHQLPNEISFVQASYGSDNYLGRDGSPIQIPINSTTSTKVYQISGTVEIVGHIHPAPGHNHPIPNNPRVSLIPYLSAVNANSISALFKDNQMSILSILCQLN